MPERNAFRIDPGSVPLTQLGRDDADAVYENGSNGVGKRPVGAISG
jgi:hypothetical protein